MRAPIVFIKTAESNNLIRKFLSKFLGGLSGKNVRSAEREFARDYLPVWQDWAYGKLMKAKKSQEAARITTGTIAGAGIGAGAFAFRNSQKKEASIKAPIVFIKEAMQKNAKTLI